VVSLWEVHGEVHVRHMGELALPILCRYFLSRTWLVLSVQAGLLVHMVSIQCFL